MCSSSFNMSKAAVYSLFLLSLLTSQVCHASSMDDSLKGLLANPKLMGSNRAFGKYLRRSAPAYWTSSEANDMSSSLSPSGSSKSAYLDNFRVLPPVKRLDAKSRSILCYFNSVSCYGR
ncbi:hypothetical protein RvY_11593 [Ramazzottius varieornatus]|uniref:Uncharacterized protein n=1 Tax=Ramazzottius varieornatus TaxID=947166 RepID=A0A1D1VKY5_RAMVA|nr:hypothetical protein RvY_11593 [Ramazzottius varieornatus]